jgi:hypothetical protein
MRSSDLDGLTLSLLLLALVHDVSQPPGVPVLLLGLFLVGVDGPLVTDSPLVHDVSANSGLSSVNVTDEDQGGGVLGGVDFVEVLVLRHVELVVLDHWAGLLLLSLLHLLPVVLLLLLLLLSLQFFKSSSLFFLFPCLFLCKFGLSLSVLFDNLLEILFFLLLLKIS